MEMDFTRYSCQMVLPGFDRQKQERLLNAKVLIVGAGGLGCPVAQYLAAVGVGNIGIVDNDTVSISNLHRQILYSPMEVGLKKATIAANKLEDQNPDIRVTPHIMRLSSVNSFELISHYDIVVDCTDNFETKYLLNDTCFLLKRPLVFGAIYQYEGQVAVWNLRNDDGTYSPNYRDVFPDVEGANVPNCAEGGVIPTLAGIIGCMQANEVVKLITQTGPVLSGKILLFDAMTLQTKIIAIGKTTKTNITAITPTFVLPELSVHELKLCMRNATVDLVDVRSTEERTAFNLGGRHIPLQYIESDFSYLNSGRPVVFYCASGVRSGQAVKTVLKRFPGVKIYSLAGGIKAWKESL